MKMTKTNSPVISVATRRLKPQLRLQLCIQAGGRCEFDGCNKYLFEHDVTLGTWRDFWRGWAT
jgi:hypothetical protein